jgi:signal transduction histidine kinase
LEWQNYPVLKKLLKIIVSDPSDKHNSRRSEGGYFLILFAIFAFVLSAIYLIGHRTPAVEKVEMSYLIEDDNREMSLQEALFVLNKGDFLPYNKSKDTLDLGYMRVGVWVLIKFTNRTDPPTSKFVLQMRHAYISGSYTPLEVNKNSNLSNFFSPISTYNFTDAKLPRLQNLANIRHVSFPIEVSPGSSYFALVRLRANAMSVPFLLLAEHDFLGSIVEEMVINGSLFGGLVLLALYNTMVGIARRENEFVLYGAYVATLSLTIVAINGSGRMFIWPEFPWVHHNSSNILINLCSISYLAFTRSIFKELKLFGFEKLLWSGAMFVCSAGILLQIFEGKYAFYSSVGANLGALLSLTLAFFRAVRARKVYGRIANLFLISESTLFLGAFVYCIKMFGWLPETPFTINVVTVAATLEGILLSFVLSEKMRRTMNEKESALQNLAEAQEHLEASVRDRTLAIAARYTSHEVLNPVFAVRLKAERIRDEIMASFKLNDENRMPTAQIVLQKTSEIFNLLDSIIHTIRAIRTLSSDGKREAIVPVVLRSACDDALRLLEAKTICLPFCISNEISGDAIVYARRSDVVQVFMNLLSNSIDAVSGKDEQWIRVSSLRSENSGMGVSAIEVSVIDSGHGPEQDVRDKLFDSEISTKDAESGMGLGLAFCQKLLTRNKGTIGLDTSSIHTRFYFVLPEVYRIESNPGAEMANEA